MTYDLSHSHDLNLAIMEAQEFGDNYIELEEWAEDMGIGIDDWRAPEGVLPGEFEDWYEQKVEAKLSASRELMTACREVRGRSYFSDLLRLGNDLVAMKRKKQGVVLTSTEGVEVTSQTGIAGMSAKDLALLNEIANRFK